MGNVKDTVEIMLENGNHNDYEEVYKIIENKQPELLQNLAFASLKKSTKVFGGIGKCQSFYPIGITLEGWFLPRVNYDCIEMYCNGVYLGNANLDIARPDVYSNFQFYNEKNAGFNFFVNSHMQDMIEKHPIVAVLKKNGQVVDRRIVNVEIDKISDYIKETEYYEESNNILFYAISNRVPMIHKISEKLKEFNSITVLEGMEDNISEVKKNCQMKYKLSPIELEQLNISMCPKLFRRNYFPSCDNVQLLEWEQEVYNEYETIQEASINISRKYNVTIEYAIKYCYLFREYIEQVIDNVRPKSVFLWNQFSPTHYILNGICKERNIPVIYMESGLLPGTYIFETLGQMGASYPTLHSDEFMNLEVSDQEIQEAEEIRKALYINKLNRWTIADPNVYSKSEKDIVLEQLNPEWPTILYAGQNDYESGIVPYTENAKKFYSPIFEDSNEAAIVIAKLAQKNHWNFIYKRHPMMRGNIDIDFPENTIINDTIDIHDAIDIADLTITILSQTSYVALIRNKPALMLGYHQLCHKGCIYEAWEIEHIESAIQSAIKNGLTEEQKANFAKHIAQLCKYYLYTDFIDQAVSFGKSVDDLKDYIEQVIQSNNSENFDIQKKRNVEIFENTENVEIQSEHENLPFYLDLSISEKIDRKKIKNSIIKKNISKQLSRSYRDKRLSKTLMYVAQIDENVRNKANWSQQFDEFLLESLYIGGDEFVNIIKECMLLNDEIKRRLQIDDNIQDAYGNVLEQHESCQKMISLCKNAEYGKEILMFINNFLLNSDMDKARVCIENIEACIEDEGYSLEIKCYFYEVLLETKQLKQKHIKKWMELLRASENKELLYYYGNMEISRAVFIYPELAYDNYYNERRELLNHISRVLLEDFMLEKPVPQYGNKRIALIVAGLHGERFASTRLQVGLANEISRRGYEVTIFVADTNYFGDQNIELWIEPVTLRKNFSKQIYRYDHLKMVDPSVKVKYFTENETGPDRYCNFIKEIMEYNPCAIVDITNEDAIYNPALKDIFPIISIPLNGYSSSSEFTAYIARNIQIAEKENIKYNSIHTELKYEANMYLPHEKCEMVYERSNYGFTDDDFLFVTVGNRLDFELTEEVQKTIHEVLQNDDNMRWILVGPIRGKLDYLEKDIKQKKVIKWGYEKYLEPLYNMCDLYLDLPRSGGGGSTAYAVECKMPAIVLDMPSDVLPFIGRENSMPDWNSAIKALIEASQSKVFCHKLARDENKVLKSEKWSIESFGEVIQQAITDLVWENQ